MATFTYIGEAESVTLHGINFPKGEPVEVSEDLHFGAGKGGKTLIPVITKLRGNSQFEEGAAKPKSPAKKGRKPKQAEKTGEE